MIFVIICQVLCILLISLINNCTFYLKRIFYLQPKGPRSRRLFAAMQSFNNFNVIEEEGLCEG
jgi:hypothetical protein